jgi:hypothetical protein
MPGNPHEPSRHSFNGPSFGGIIGALTNCIYTISGVGTATFTLDPSGYPSNFTGVVRAIEDLNLSLSGVSTQASAVVSGLVGGSGVYITTSGGSSVINIGVVGQGSTSVVYSGSRVTISGQVVSPTIISGSPGSNYTPGTLWYDTNEGRLFVYASGNGISDPAWYQTNAEALALKSDLPPSGAGYNAPPRDGSLWFNNLVGNLFVYDATSSGWYETGPSRGAAYGVAAPAPGQQGGLWYDSGAGSLRVWNGTAWV